MGKGLLTTLGAKTHKQNTCPTCSAAFQHTPLAASPGLGKAMQALGSLLGRSAAGADSGGGYPTGPGSSATASSAGTAGLTRQYYEHNRLDFGQLLEDGFQDAGLGVDPAHAGSSVVVDRRRDHSLERFLDRCRKKLRKAKDEPTQVMVLALLVSDTCGRSGKHADNLAQRHARLVSENRNSDSGEVLLGDLTGDRVTGADRRGKTPPTGAALVPYRALLFKAFSDWLSLPECMLQRRAPTPGERPSPLYSTATWNIVQIAQALYVVDVLFDPGALYEQHSAKAQEYHRLLLDSEAACAAATGEKRTAPAAPSSRKELGGYMPRPSWHVEPWELEIQRGDRALGISN